MSFHGCTEQCCAYSEATRRLVYVDLIEQRPIVQANRREPHDFVVHGRYMEEKLRPPETPTNGERAERVEEVICTTVAPSVHASRVIESTDDLYVGVACFPNEDHEAHQARRRVAASITAARPRWDRSSSRIVLASSASQVAR